MFYKIHGVRALIYNNGKLLILKRSDSDKNDPNLWDIPGGKVEPCESVNEAIKREVLEEAGIETSAITIKDLYGFIFENFDATNKLVIAVFICSSTASDIRLSSEHSEYSWINAKDIYSHKLSRILEAIHHSL